MSQLNYLLETINPLRIQRETYNERLRITATACFGIALQITIAIVALNTRGGF